MIWMSSRCTSTQPTRLIRAARLVWDVIYIYIYTAEGRQAMSLFLRDQFISSWWFESLCNQSSGFRCSAVLWVCTEFLHFSGFIVWSDCGIVMLRSTPNETSDNHPFSRPHQTKPCFFLSSLQSFLKIHNTNLLFLKLYYL
jgi:hypothetical protein